MTPHLRAPVLAVAAALAVVYVVWGSTYLTIAWAIETVPPFLMGAARFLAAGVVLVAWELARGAPRPTLVHWRSALLLGGGFLFVGNGGVIWGERTVATGIASLIIATVPLWLVVLDRVALGRRLNRITFVGIVAGFAGTALLVVGGGAVDLGGAIALFLSPVGWASATLYSRTAPLPSRPLLGAGIEMIAGGALLGVAGLAHGEASQVGAVSLRSGLSLAYLVVFGSLLAFSAYVWVVRVAPTPLVGTYAYVNPVVAVILGVLFNGESLHARTLVAGAIVLGAVVLIVNGSGRDARAARKATVPAGAPAD